jgi:hypothetical protein
MYKKWTTEDFVELTRLHSLGYTAKEIALALGCSDETVKSYKVKLGLSKRKGTNTKLTSSTIEEDRFTEYREYLVANNIEVVALQNVKGNSTFRCIKCGNQWITRLYDLVKREQECGKCKPRHTSKIANNWLDSLGISNREVPVHQYFVDGMSEDGKTVYEFLGDFWHGNLEVFNEDAINPIRNITYLELFEETFTRLKYIKDLGFNIVFIWESDFLKQKPPQEF